MRSAVGTAREHGLPVHLHAAENRDQTDTSPARHGRTPIEVLERTGVLDTDVLIAHGTGITEGDLPLLARAVVREPGGAAARPERAGTRPARPGVRHLKGLFRGCSATC